ncbi:hypothetical protein AVEN_72319-1 [Araneus ventricosus]|uniref:DDE-1 domain-containing protein n=1 Tax=Araneus ventricosus TaxID=182803 RepID=A0A4Y2NMZ9_ARAVE|nr:hypothetical protein AVEN_72319-1 [Araneus ventricosus]
MAAENEAVAPGRKKLKARVTILGCANASGSHRVKLTLVGKRDDDEEEAACSNVQFWKSLTLKDCVYMINKVWESVPEYTLKRSWRKLAPILENVEQSNDRGSVTVAELNGLLKEIPGSGNCEEDEVISWLDCDADQR